MTGVACLAAFALALTAVPTPPAAPPLAPAPATAEPAAGTAEDIAGWADVARRMSVPVMVNGKGPFRFIVDTGADTSVLARELAAELGLAAGRPQKVHSAFGAEITPASQVASLEVGSRRLTGLSLPTLPGRHLGGQGILGLDALADQRIVLDFARSNMRVERSRGMGFSDPDAVVVRAKRRFGRLVLVESSLVGRPVYVILDSGAQNTIANAALQRLLTGRRRPAPRLDAAPPADGSPAVDESLVSILSVTGQTGQGREGTLSEMVLGGVALRNVPVIYADLHAFEKFDLAGEPAMLLGVDVMRAFRQVDVDFGRREVRFGLMARRPGGAGVSLAFGGSSRVR